MLRSLCVSSIGRLYSTHCDANELYCLSSLLIGGEGFPKVNEVALFGNRKYLRTRLGYRRKPSEEVGSMLMRDVVMK